MNEPVKFTLIYLSLSVKKDIEISIIFEDIWFDMHFLSWYLRFLSRWNYIFTGLKWRLELRLSWHKRQIFANFRREGAISPSLPCSVRGRNRWTEPLKGKIRPPKMFTFYCCFGTGHIISRQSLQIANLNRQFKNRIFIIAFDFSQRRVWPCHLRTIQTDSFQESNGPLPDRNSEFIVYCFYRRHKIATVIQR